MTRTHAFSLKKIVETKKISAVLLDDIKLLMFEYCLLIISVEIYSIYNGYGEDFSAGSFILNALFSHTRIIILAIIAIQILFHALRKFKKYIVYGSALLALVSICLFPAFGSFWEKNSINTLLIIFLAIMTLCAIQPKKFSFYYFLSY